MFAGGLEPVGLTATNESPVVEHKPVPVGGWVKTMLSKSSLREANIILPYQ